MERRTIVQIEQQIIHKAPVRLELSSSAEPAGAFRRLWNDHQGMQKGFSCSLYILKRGFPSQGCAHQPQVAVIVVSGSLGRFGPQHSIETTFLLQNAENGGSAQAPMCMWYGVLSRLEIREPQGNVRDLKHSSELVNYLQY